MTVRTALVLACMTLGCQGIVGIKEVTLASDATSGTETTPSEAGGDTQMDTSVVDTHVPDAGEPCQSMHGPKMVLAGAPGAKYCIDTTEVTVDQFEEFAESPTKPPPQTRCVGDATVMPRKVGGENGTFPRYAANWCHADAFCAWADKRLCRPEEWRDACRGGSPGTQFPYGDTFDNTVCVSNVTNHAPVKSAIDCHGTVAPYDQIFDMSGNLAEWVDDCDADMVDHCRPRGGYYEDTESKYYDCEPNDAVEVRPFKQNHKGNGFRCCKDAP